MSDFPRAVARVSEGFCALCDGPLDEFGACGACNVGWTLDTTLGAGQPMLKPSRSLTPAEITKLYNRAHEP